MDSEIVSTTIKYESRFQRSDEVAWRSVTWGALPQAAMNDAVGVAETAAVAGCGHRLVATGLQGCRTRPLTRR